MEALGKQVREILVASPFMKEDPLRVFSLAFRYGWETVGTIAARNTLAIPQQYLSSSEELSFISGLELHGLADFRYRCAQEIRRWIFSNPYTSSGHKKVLCSFEGADYIWLGTRGYEHIVTCPSSITTLSYQPVTEFTKLVSFTYPNVRFRRWWVDYFIKLLHRLEVCPTAKTVLVDGNLSESTLVAAAACSGCAVAAFVDLPKFKKSLAQGIIQVIAQVRHAYLEKIVSDPIYEILIHRYLSISISSKERFELLPFSLKTAHRLSFWRILSSGRIFNSRARVQCKSPSQ